MNWHQTNRADPRAALLADRHYSRQAPGTRQFTPPGRILVLVTAGYDAVWATSWPLPAFVNRVYPGAWVCTLFRNESTHRASTLIREAVAATRWYFGPPPAEGMITLIDRAKVRATMVRGRPTWGYSYRKAGFVDAAIPSTKSGLMILQLHPHAMPAPQRPFGAQMALAEMEEVTA